VFSTPENNDELLFFWGGKRLCMGVVYVMERVDLITIITISRVGWWSSSAYVLFDDIPLIYKIQTRLLCNNWEVALW